jgi:hypothetical protein
VILMTVHEHEKKTIDSIRSSCGEPLNSLTDEELVHLYSIWSDYWYHAGWINEERFGLEQFNAWATTPPCEWVRRVDETETVGVN